MANINNADVTDSIIAIDERIAQETSGGITTSRGLELGALRARLVTQCPTCPPPSDPPPDE